MLSFCRSLNWLNPFCTFWCCYCLQDGLTGSAWGDWANYTASPLRWAIPMQVPFDLQLMEGFLAATTFWKTGKLPNCPFQMHSSKHKISHRSFGHSIRKSVWSGVVSPLSTVASWRLVRIGFGARKKWEWPCDSEFCVKSIPRLDGWENHGFPFVYLGFPEMKCMHFFKEQITLLL